MDRNNIGEKTKSRRVILQRVYLIDRRVSLSLSVELVSRKLNVSANYYYQIENGQKGKNLPVCLLLKIAKALEMDKHDILDFENEYIELLRVYNQNG
ncbi:MAG: helix-turn-helix transcriptional regulator [Tenericutes bacterium]|nr:helix-turn-helix transcriptional regulator [Mycoplasmatota bacterium]